MNLFTATPDGDVSMDSDFNPADPAVASSSRSVSSNPEVSNQRKLNDLICDTNLSKEK